MRLRGGAVAAHQVHCLEVGGSIPSPATLEGVRLSWSLACSRLAVGAPSPAVESGGRVAHHRLPPDTTPPGLDTRRVCAIMPSMGNAVETVKSPPACTWCGQPMRLLNSELGRVCRFCDYPQSSNAKPPNGWKRKN